MTEYYNTQTRERRYSYNKPDGHDWIRWDMFNQNTNDRDNDDDDLGSTLVTAAITVGAELLGGALSGDGGSSSSFGDIFSGGGGDFGGGGASEGF